MESSLRDRIRDLRSQAIASPEEERVAIVRALNRSYMEDYEVCAYRSVLEAESIVESNELFEAFEKFRQDFGKYDVNLLDKVEDQEVKQVLANCRSPYLQSKILAQKLSDLPNADEMSMILHGDNDADLVVAAVEIVANMHLLEKVSRPLQLAYTRLRQEYGVGCQIDIDAKTDTLKLSFTKSDPKLRTSSEYAACVITMAKRGKMRVQGTSKEFGDLNKLGMKPRDVVYAIDTWLDRD